MFCQLIVAHPILTAFSPIHASVLDTKAPSVFFSTVLQILANICILMPKEKAFPMKTAVITLFTLSSIFSIRIFATY